jgi:putative glycosyltransferase (TIGR04348 family)
VGGLSNLRGVMRIVVVTPAPPRSRSGNRVTALRWARMLRSFGHRVQVCHDRAAPPADLMVALHADKSAAAACSFDGALVVALTGTDLYGDLSRDARAALDAADAIVALQPKALDRLPERWRVKTEVVLQSAPPCSAIEPRTKTFDVCVVGHLRDVKDPMRTALASRQLPAQSRIAVLHAGAALSDEYARLAAAEMDDNPRYRWLGELSHWRARRLIARSRVLVLSSRMEGGAHVIAEAVTCGTAVLASEIDGTIGQLGADYPGYFPVADTDALAALLNRVEISAAYRSALTRYCKRVAPKFTVEREARALARVLSRALRT